MALNQATHGAELVSVTCRAPETSSEPIALFPHFLWLRHIGRYSPEESAAGVPKERVQAVKQPVMRVKQSQDLHCDGTSYLGCGAHSTGFKPSISEFFNNLWPIGFKVCKGSSKGLFFKKSNWFWSITVHSNVLNRPGQKILSFSQKSF